MNTFWILMFAVFGLMDCKQKKNNDEKKDLIKRKRK